MKATQSWGLCACGCGHEIKPGADMKIIDGDFFIGGHEIRKTRTMKALKPSSGKEKKPDNSAQLDLFE